MAKKIDLTKEETLLYNELKSLSKRANQRILRLERLTGEKGTFGVKQLYDYLSSSELDALSSKGRIKLKKSYSMTQFKAIIKATNQFLNKSPSKVSQVKKITKEYSEKAGKPLSYSQADTLYRARKNYTWIYAYMTPSEFWSFVQLAKESGWNQETFINQIESYIDAEIDEEMIEDLKDLYDYVMGE